MLIGATLSFVFLIGGGIYAFKLYVQSKDTKVSGNIYQPKDPKISFDEYKTIHNKKIEELKRKKESIRAYVEQIIKDGSKDHGYPLGSMPGGLIKDLNETKKIAKYIANGLKGKRPNYFNACVACHGEDGKGNNGQAPDLLKLPIYNGLVKKKSKGVAYAPSLNKQNSFNYSDPLKQYSAEIATMINRYAIEVGQQGVTVDDIFKYIKQVKRRYDEDTFYLFKNQLKDGLNKLIDYGKSFKNSKEDEDYAIKWEEFIIWFKEDFDNQLAKEKEKYNSSVNRLERLRSEKMNKAFEAKTKLFSLLSTMGIALIVFILFTMILVLFKIEFNTRNKIVGQEE